MATRAEITNDLRHTFGRSYVSKTDVARYMGVNKAQAKMYLSGVDYVVTGEKDRGKRYLARDVADMIFRRQVRR